MSQAHPAPLSSLLKLNKNFPVTFEDVRIGRVLRRVLKMAEAPLLPFVAIASSCTILSELLYAECLQVSAVTPTAPLSVSSREGRPECNLDSFCTCWGLYKVCSTFYVEFIYTHKCTHKKCWIFLSKVMLNIICTQNWRTSIGKRIAWAVIIWMWTSLLINTV